MALKQGHTFAFREISRNYDLGICTTNLLHDLCQASYAVISGWPIEEVGYSEK